MLRSDTITLTIQVSECNGDFATVILKARQESRKLIQQDRTGAPPSANMLNLHLSSHRTAIVLALFGFFCVTGRCLAHDNDLLCNDGDGSFHAESHTGVTVRVGAARNGELATRKCEATLSWNKQAVTVATSVTQLDLDVFGVDLGLGVPVAAFQIRKSDSQCCMEYQLYSLEKPPRLLRTITGGDFFSAADIDLDGRLEIWTDDAVAVNGFENLSLAEFDSAPTVVLRFVRGDLVDASSEFQAYVDDEVTRLRQELDPDDLRDFKNTDGKLSPNAPLPVDRLHRLRGVKGRILEIVWSYLYSGREQQAWGALAETWPEPDVERIRAAILNARAHGILAQVTRVSPVSPGKRGKHVRIFDATTQSAGVNLEVIPPEPIMLRRPPLPGIADQTSSSSELLLELIIDSAGKVRSAEPSGKATSMNSTLIHAAAEWKFIPALDAGRPVASRTRLAVSLRQ